MGTNVDGLFFDGPHKLHSWVIPRQAGVYFITKPAANGNHDVLYVGETGNCQERGFPSQHHKYSSWVNQAGLQQNVHIYFHHMPGSTDDQRRHVEAHFVQKFNPPCNG